SIDSTFEWVFERPRLALNEPPNPCPSLIQDASNCPHPYRGSSTLTGEPPYTIFASVDEVTAWLANQGYDAAPEFVTALDGYAAQDMAFVVVTGSGGGGWDWLPTVTITYPGTAAVVPLQLAALSAGLVYLEVAVLATTPYTIDNFTRLAPDYGQLSHIPELDYAAYQYSAERCGQGYLVPYSPLERAFRRWIQEEQDGLAFVPEYVGDADILLDDRLEADTYAEVQALVDGYSHLSLLYLQLNSSQMVRDPVLVPDPEAPAVSNIIDLAAYDVNPMTYWGCAAPLDFDDPDGLLPAASTEVPAWGEAVYHPDGWVLSEIPLSIEEDYVCPAMDITLNVLAPQPVTVDDLRAALLGQSSIAPLFVFTPQLGSNLAGRLGIDVLPDPSPVRLTVDWYQPFGMADFCLLLESSRELFVVTTPDDWVANGELYQTIAREAASYYGYAHPELPHTAFLTNKLQRRGTFPATTGVLGYPDGWQVYTTFDATRRYWAVPEGAAFDDPGPRLAILGWDVLLGTERDEEAYWLGSQGPDATPRWLDAVHAHYALPDDIDRDYLNVRRWKRCANPEGLTLDERLIPFALDGREGYILLADEDVVEISAPVGEFAAVEDLLRQMVDGYDDHLMCG
ncbi:MAG: hypothetical protein GYB65_16665, partial [Chloroflexi bacterium]|nr:hypothetical protein [Chloroflexota bacterium]